LAHLPSACLINTQSKPPEEEEGDDESEDREASSVGVDSDCEEVLPWVTSGRATAVLITGSSSSTGKVSLDTEDSEQSLATSYGEGLAESSVSTVDGTSSREVVLPAAESRRLEEHLPGPNPNTSYKGRTRADERHRLEDTTTGLMVFEEMKIVRCVEEAMFVMHYSGKVPS